MPRTNASSSDKKTNSNEKLDSKKIKILDISDSSEQLLSAQETKKIRAPKAKSAKQTSSNGSTKSASLINSNSAASSEVVSSESVSDEVNVSDVSSISKTKTKKSTKKARTSKEKDVLKDDELPLFSSMAENSLYEDMPNVAVKNAVANAAAALSVFGKHRSEHNADISDDSSTPTLPSYHELLHETNTVVTKHNGDVKAKQFKLEPDNTSLTNTGTIPHPSGVKTRGSGVTSWLTTVSYSNRSESDLLSKTEKVGNVEILPDSATTNVLDVREKTFKDNLSKDNLSIASVANTSGAASVATENDISTSIKQDEIHHHLNNDLLDNDHPLKDARSSIDASVDGLESSLLNVDNTNNRGTKVTKSTIKRSLRSTKSNLNSEVNELAINSKVEASQNNDALLLNNPSISQESFDHSNDEYRDYINSDSYLSSVENWQTQDRYGSFIDNEEGKLEALVPLNSESLDDDYWLGESQENLSSSFEVPDYIREQNEQNSRFYDELENSFILNNKNGANKFSTDSNYYNSIIDDLFNSASNDHDINVRDYMLDDIDNGPINEFARNDAVLKNQPDIDNSYNITSENSSIGSTFDISRGGLNHTSTISNKSRANSHNDISLVESLYKKTEAEPISLPKNYEPSVVYEGIRNVNAGQSVSDESTTQVSENDTKDLLGKLTITEASDLSGDNATHIPSLVSTNDMHIEWRKDLSNDVKDSLRIVLAEKKFARSEIYKDPYFLAPVDPLAKKASELIAKKWAIEEIPADGTSLVLKFASQVDLVTKIDLAFISYLNEHFPMGNIYDQEQFNVVVLALFNLMQNGDICINLNGLNSIFDVLMGWYEQQQRVQIDGEQTENLDRFIDAALIYAPSSVNDIYELLLKSPAVGIGCERNSPLVLDINRLYIRRYYKYEVAICKYISNVKRVEYSDEQLYLIQKAISVLFEQQYVNDDINHQKVATLLSTVSNFTVISGGPGTGKTTTVMRILLLLICLDPQNRSIALCAPTGKAAARMGESIIKQLKDPVTSQMIQELSKLFGIDPNEIVATIPKEAITVQRLLKVRPNHATPIFNKDRKLQCDVLVVDEVSMLDIALFYRVLEALPNNCKLIMLGDKDQLSSVEAGAVLGEICQRLNDTRKDRLAPDTLNFICAMSGYRKAEILNSKIAEHTALLQFSYRSKDVPEIGILAKIINETSLNYEAYQQTANSKEVENNGKDDSTFSYSLDGHYLLSGTMNEFIEQAQNEGNSFGGYSVLFYRYYERAMFGLKQLFNDCRNKAIEQLKLKKLAPILRQYIEQLKEHTNDDSIDISELASFSKLKKEIELDKAYPGRVDFYIKYLKLETADALNDLSPQQQEAKEVMNKPLGHCLPAISYITLKDDEKLIDVYRKQIAKSCVRRGRLDNYSAFLEKLAANDFAVSSDPEERDRIFKLMDGFRVLCSNHNGMLGDKALNEFISSEVKSQYLKGYGNFIEEEFFPGQIVIITKNDPVLGLVNGYVGFCAYDENEIDFAKEETEIAKGLAYSRRKAELAIKATISSDKNPHGKENDTTKPKTSNFNEEALRRWYKQKVVMKRTLRVFIPVSVEEKEGKSFTKVKTISTLLLTHYDTGFAMSIHKSQGSEYDKVMIVLSDKVNRVLTKELVYTGVTRAKKCVELVAKERCLKYAISHSVNRESGLAYRLKMAELNQNNSVLSE